MFNSVDIQSLFSVILERYDPEAFNNLESACQVPHRYCFVAYAWLRGKQGAAFRASA